jgi:tetratricopeptide (TPR) repeat protein
LTDGIGQTGSPPALSARALARQEGARFVVVPALYRDNEVLRFQARIIDVADGRLAGSVEPVEASVALPLAGIEELGHRVLGALYPVLDTQMTHIRALPRAPRFDAYRAYIAGRDAHAVRDLPAALRNFRHAAALDSTFILPHVTAAIVMNMINDLAGADSIVRSLEGREERLDAFSRAHVEWLRGSLSGDRHASYAGMRDAARLAPGSTLVTYQFAAETVDLGRPQEAADLLLSITPERGELRGWIGYWQVLTAALHLQNDHRRELREAERARGLYPDDPRALIMELQALAALGRTTRIERLIDAAATRPAPGEPSPGALMLNTALELRAHPPIWRRGRHERMADSLIARAIRWYRSRPPEQQSVREHYELTIALTVAGRTAEARRLLERLPLSPPARPAGPSPFASRSSPGFPDDVAYRGSIGVLAARDGDPVRAAEALAWLEAFDRPYARGRPTYWRAAILAGLGRRDEAVALLRTAFDEGLPYSRQLHLAPELAPLRDHRPFQLLMLTPD